MEEVKIKIGVDGSQASESVGSLKKQLKEAQQEVQILSDKFGSTSEQAVAAAKKAADLKDRIGDAKALTDAFNPDRKFQAFGSALQGVAGGFAAVQGALGLVGVKSDEVEKTLLKVQSAMALSQGVNAIMEAGDAFKNLKTVAIDALKGIKTAIGSTGIGLLVVALGTIVAYWDDIKAAISGVSQEQRKLTAESSKNFQIEKEKLEKLNKQENSLRLQGKSEKEILQYKINQVNQSIEKGEIDLKNQKRELKFQIEAETRNKEILKGLLEFVSGPIIAILDAVDKLGKIVKKDFGLKEGFKSSIANLIFDPEEVKRKGEATLKQIDNELEDLKSQRAGFQLSIQNIDKQAAEKSKQSADEKRKREDELEKERLQKKREAAKELQDLENENFLRSIQDEKQRQLVKLTQDYEAQQEAIKQKQYAKEQEYALLKELENKFNADVKAITDAQAEEKRLKEEKDFNDLVDRLAAEAEAERQSALKAAEAQKQIEKEKSDFKKQQLNEVGNAIGKLGELVGKETAAGKALGIATSLINTYQGATEALKQKSTLPSPFDFAAKAVNVAAIIASGLKSVKAIAAVKVPGGGGSASIPSSNISATGGAAPISPSLPIQNTLTQLNQQSINQLGSATNRAYVVESDITNNQERIRRINRAARLN